MSIDQELERLLHELGDEVPLPAGGAAAVRDITRGPVRPRRWRPRRPDRRWLLPSAAAGVVTLVVVLTVVGTLTGGGSRPSAPSAPTALPAQFRHATGGTSAGPASASAPAAPPVPAADTPFAGPKPGAAVPTPAADRVVETGDVALQVPRARVGSTVSGVTAVAARFAGFVASSRLDTGGGDPSGTVTLRIPVANFQPAVTAVGSLGHVQSSTTSAQDVTAQYTDLGARIAALSVSRSTYLTILSKATTIGDVLAVQQQIDSIQQQIDELQGQQKLLKDQSDMSSLTVDVSPNGAVAPPVTPRPQNGLEHAVLRGWRGFLHGLEGLIGALGPLLFALLLAAAVFVLGRLAWRRIRRSVV